MLQNSLSNHLDKFTVTDILWKPTSKKRTKANIVVKPTQKLVINLAPLLPTFLAAITPASEAPPLLFYFFFWVSMHTSRAAQKKKESDRAGVILTDLSYK